MNTITPDIMSAETSTVLMQHKVKSLRMRLREYLWDRDAEHYIAVMYALVEAERELLAIRKQLEQF